MKPSTVFYAFVVIPAVTLSPSAVNAEVSARPVVPGVW